MLTTPQRSRTAGGAAFVEVGTGEPLILIHGVGMRLEAWAPQIDGLAASHRVIAVDIPGHGASDALPEGSRLEDFVVWAGRLLDDLRLDRVNVAGHSMGALIAGGMAATFGARVCRVALLNGVYRRPPEAAEAVRLRAAAIARGGVDLEGPLRRWFGEPGQQDEAYRLTRTWLATVDPKGYSTAYSAFAHGDATYADAWATVTAPALFLTGRDDPNSTPEMAEAMAKAAPNGLAVVIEGHRHMVNLTAPEAVNRILADWLQLPEGGQ